LIINPGGWGYIVTGIILTALFSRIYKPYKSAAKWVIGAMVVIYFTFLNNFI
jgi:hypothetical protein